MKVEIKSISDLKDSKLLYEKNLPPFGYLIVIIVMLLIITVVIWSMNTNKPYVIKGEGTIESSNKTYVVPPFSGEISEVNIKEGKYVNKGEVLFKIKNIDINMQREQIAKQIELMEKQVKNYEVLVKSIKDNKNYFDEANSDESFFYNKYETYKRQTDQQTLDTSLLKQYGYTEEQIELELDKIDGKKAELYFSAISDAENNRLQLEGEMEILMSQLKSLEEGAQEYNVKANASGKVHLLGTCKDGVVVQAATPVASIGAELDEFVVVSYIDAGSRSRIKENNSVKVVVDGLQQNVYGVIKGKVSQIDSDATITEDGKSYFKIEILLNKQYLVNKAGNKVNLSNGMKVETRIIYDEITYMQYILNELGVRK